MTFLTKEQLIKLLDGFDIEYFQEIEEDGTSGTGLKCHSHIFYVIAKKTTEGKSVYYKQLKIKSYKH